MNDQPINNKDNQPKSTSNPSPQEKPSLDTKSVDELKKEMGEQIDAISKSPQSSEKPKSPAAGSKADIANLKATSDKEAGGEDKVSGAEKPDPAKADAACQKSEDKGKMPEATKPDPAKADAAGQKSAPEKKPETEQQQPAKVAAKAEGSDEKQAAVNAKAQDREADEKPAASTEAENAGGEKSETEVKEQPKKSSNMVKCHKCGYLNRAGTLICDRCGTILIADAMQSVSTKTFENEEVEEAIASKSSPEEVKAVKTAGSSVITDQSVLRFEIEGVGEIIEMKIRSQMILGRSDSTAGVYPEIDLGPFAGYRMGVSRRHATIQVQNQHIHLHDMGSCNGTFLNGMRLTPYEAYQLRDGDEIGLGQMLLKLYIK